MMEKIREANLLPSLVVACVWTLVKGGLCAPQVVFTAGLEDCEVDFSRKVYKG